MYKIYPSHRVFGYCESPTIVQLQEEVMPLVNKFLSEGTDYYKCCVIKRENNADEVYGIFFKEKEMSAKTYIKRR